MYVVSVFSDNKIEKTIKCEKLSEVISTLENIQPDLDSSFLVWGDDTSINFDDKVYSVTRLQDCQELLGV